MSLRNRNIVLLYSLVALLASSCANQSSPTGGPKDEDPPTLLASTPHYKQLNYSDTKITLEFDEAIKLNNAKEEIIITPRLKNDFEVKYKKNKVILELQDTLTENTTYTINFREAIQDLNEGNAPENLQLAFSTGDYLDSLIIQGSVKYLLTNKEATDITMSLYEADDTLDIFNSPPVYLTKSNDAGLYKFENIKQGNYKLYVFDDKNKNLKLDSKNEAYGFVPEVIVLDSSQTDIDIPLINLNLSEFKMQSARLSGHYYTVKYNKFIYNYELKSELADSLLYRSLEDDHKQLKFYNTNNITDSLELFITAYDTLNESIIDTVYLKFEDTKRKKAEFKTTYKLDQLDKDKPVVHSTLTFTKPILSIDYDSLYINIDSLTQIPLFDKDFTWNTEKTEVTIDKQLDKELFASKEEEEEEETIPFDSTARRPSLPKPDYFVYYGTNAFTSVEQDSTQSHKEKITFINPSSMGIILIEVQTDKPRYIVQLLNNSNDIVRELTNEKKFSFENVKPATYRIRVLIDTNNNGVWDIGNIQTNTPPEPVVFYTSEEGTSDLTLRANWELGPNVIKF